ncbi:HU family DNA-binding protein [Tabrizicola sp.]|uniref:HU family DNA-binding protein n=1 Tax=Tabrizicola sp. TaxID=2005166 RepID=UPI00273238C5|nr:HU family DNA-binding protein [Tabrizicola sp.]MDP3196785.1 HU family DNA-binding protein [Tabrizicola sp.]
MAPRSPKDPETEAAKPARPSRAAKAKPAAGAPEKPPLRVVEAESVPTPGADTIKLKDLIDQVAQATGGKKADVKPVIEALLTAMGTALATGKSLAIPPLGKLRVVKNKGPALTLKLRLADGAKAAGLALADDGEDG